MNIIEITAEQAEQFRAAGIRVRFAIHPSDLVLPAAVIDVTPKPVITRQRETGRTKFTQAWRKGTLVRLGDSHQRMLDNYSNKSSKLYDVYQAVALLLNEHGKPMLRHKLWHATNKFLGKKYTGTSTTLTKMLRTGFLVEVGQ